MSGDVSFPTLSIADFEAIEAAVMETSRGRWFLAEFARRNRTADTGMLLEALARIETSVKASPGVEPDLLGLRRDLADMADSIARTRRDIAASLVDASGGALPQPGRAFDDLLGAAEKADSETFNAAENAQEMAWSLREAGNLAAAGAADRHALDLYRASSQHALTTTRVRTLIDILRTIEGRIQAMMGSEAEPTAARAAPLSLPVAPRGEAPEDDGVMFVGFASPAPPAPPPRRQAEPPHRPRDITPPPADPRLAPFAAIESLDASQRLALFV
ncbi:MAG: hypothetical protein ACOYOJ_04450 [Alsobacter sp.]